MNLLPSHYIRTRLQIRVFLNIMLMQVLLIFYRLRILLPRNGVVVHHIKCGIAFIQPLIHSFHFSFQQQTVSVSAELAAEHSVHQRVEHRQESPRGWPDWLRCFTQFHQFRNSIECYCTNQRMDNR